MKELNMPRLCFYVSLRCNLRCKLCGSFSPYYDVHYHPDMQKLCGDVDRCFEIVDHVGICNISGGEPFLRSDFYEFINHVSKYKEKVDRFDVFTNGTILPSDKLLDSFSALGNKLRIVLDDYGPDFSKSAQKVMDRLILLKDTRVDRRKYHSGDAHLGGWVDYGISAHSKRKSDEEAKRLFAKCANHTVIEFCAPLLDGTLFPCSPLRRLVELNVIPARPDETFDLYDKTYTDDEIRERIAALYSKDVLSACAYCNGLCDDSVRYAPAEQLPQLA